MNKNLISALKDRLLFEIKMLEYFSCTTPVNKKLYERAFNKTKRRIKAIENLLKLIS